MFIISQLMFRSFLKNKKIRLKTYASFKLPQELKDLRRLFPWQQSAINLIVPPSNLIRFFSMVGMKMLLGLKNLLQDFCRCVRSYEFPDRTAKKITGKFVPFLNGVKMDS